MIKCYCIHCGTENNKNDFKCRICSRVLEPLDITFTDFLKKEIRDKFKDKVVDSTKDFIISYIKSHIYSIVMTISIVGVIFTNVVSSTIPKEKIVTERPIVINKLDYKEYETIMKDVLTSITLNENLTKYKYSTYYKINNDKLKDYSYEFIRDLNKVKEDNKRYSLLFNLQVYTDDMIHYWKLEDFINKYQDEQLGNEFYELHKAMYKIAVSDESIFRYVEDVRNLYVTIKECTNEECIPNPNTYDYLGTKRYYHFTFIKREGSWYFLKLAETEVSTMPDSGFLGSVYNGKWERFSFDDFNE